MRLDGAGQARANQYFANIIDCKGRCGFGWINEQIVFHRYFVMLMIQASKSNAAPKSKTLTCRNERIPRRPRYFKKMRRDWRKHTFGLVAGRKGEKMEPRGTRPGQIGSMSCFPACSRGTDTDAEKFARAGSHGVITIYNQIQRRIAAQRVISPKVIARAAAQCGFPAEAGQTKSSEHRSEEHTSEI